MNWFAYITAHLAGPIGYAGVLVLLTACGLGVPVPEDIILISGGFIAANAGDRPWPMMLVGLVGIIIGDSIIYTLGRTIGRPIAQRPPLNGVLTSDRLARVEKMFKRYGQVILMAARFMPGVRAVAFFSAGTTKVPYYKFVAFDGSAALVSAPLWVFLGYHFGNDVLDKAKQLQHWLIPTFAVLLVIFAIERYFTHRRRDRQAARTTSETTLPPVTSTDRGVPVVPDGNETQVPADGIDRPATGS